MKDIKHHLIGYIDSTCITNNIFDYKTKAVTLVGNSTNLKFRFKLDQWSPKCRKFDNIMALLARLDFRKNFFLNFLRLISS